MCVTNTLDHVTGMMQMGMYGGGGMDMSGGSMFPYGVGQNPHMMSNQPGTNMCCHDGPCFVCSNILLINVYKQLAMDITSVTW